MRTATGLAASAIALAGCGGGDDYAGTPRPPVPVNVTAAITQGRVSVSPTKIGAGPVVIIVANETDRVHRVTVETDVLGASTGGIRQQSAPINPRGNGSLKLDMRKGRYTVKADGGLSPARLKVGSERASAQNLVEQP